MCSVVQVQGVGGNILGIFPIHIIHEQQQIYYQKLKTRFFECDENIRIIDKILFPYSYEHLFLVSTLTEVRYIRHAIL